MKELFLRSVRRFFVQTGKEVPKKKKAINEKPLLESLTKVKRRPLLSTPPSPRRSSLLGVPGMKFRRRVSSQDRAWLKSEGRQVASAWMTGGKFLLNGIYDEFQEDDHWELSPYYFSARDSFQPMHQRRSTDVFKMIHLKREQDSAHVFIFESGAVVSWGLNGGDRDRIDERLKSYHTSEGWPAPFELQKDPTLNPVRYFRKLRWSQRHWDYSVFDRGKDPSRNIAREDFDLDWEYTGGFSLDFSNSKSTGGSKEPPSLSFKSVDWWTEDQVAKWLRKRNLEALVDKFKANQIDGSVLRKLTHEDIVTQLIEGNVGLQKKFEAELAEIRPRGLFTDKNKLVLDDENDVDVLIAISLGMAQAAQLQVLTSQLDWMHEISKTLIEQLKDHRETFLETSDLTQLLGYIQSLGHQFQDTSLEPNLRDTPEFLWDVSHVEQQYNMTIEHLNFDEDLEHWREKWELVKENVAEDRSWTQESYVGNLEFYIVAILVVELPGSLTHICELIYKLFQWTQHLS